MRIFGSKEEFNTGWQSWSSKLIKNYDCGNLSRKLKLKFEEWLQIVLNISNRSEETL